MIMDAVLRPEAAKGPASRLARQRIESIDILRGLIMVLMALDHTRDFVFGLHPSPTDLEATTPALFATRWITHFCAPGFLLLAGVSALLQLDRRGPGGLAVLLVTRGAFLIVLELTIVTFGWIPDPSRSLVLLQVIWAIGWSMILLSPLVFLPASWVGMLGVFVAVLHPLLSDGLASIGAPEALRVLLIDANKNLVWGGVRYIVSYPILPWFAVMAAGYALGALIRARPSDWSRLFAWLGLVLTFCFVALRATGMGLDPEPWQPDLGGMRSVLSFLNTHKYPPSPMYLMMTLGPPLLLLSLFERRGAGPAGRILSTFGRAPLFFYVLHLYALRSFGLAAAALVWGAENLGPPPQHSAPEWPLLSAWVVWVLAILALYRPTRWFADLKARTGKWWMSYL
jgi:uncharacterized membrane protein